MVKAADMMIARRADTRARADFATWKMIAKLNGASSLSAEAQKFLASYKALLNDMPEDGATEATIRLMYKTYYAEMGGIGKPPEVRPVPSEPKAESKTDNVTAFRANVVHELEKRPLIVNIPKQIRQENEKSRPDSKPYPFVQQEPALLSQQ